MRLIFFYFPLIFFFICNSLEAQSLKKVKEIKAGQIENVAIDRLGDFFLVFKNGEIKKYDANGKVYSCVEKPESSNLA